MTIKAVAFDFYGTLGYIADPWHPYRDLVKLLQVDPPTAARAVMTCHLDLNAVAHLLKPDLCLNLSVIEHEIACELKSARLYPDVSETIAYLKMKHYRLAVVSNLTLPYAEPIDRLLPAVFDERVFSFDVGAIKPEPAMFQQTCVQLGCEPAEVLMIGDSWKCDVCGARDFGMPAVYLDRKRQISGPGRMATLCELPGILENESDVWLARPE